jgi:glutaredoxin
MREVLMYSRPRCGLCDEARETILAVRGRVEFDFRELDVSGDDALELAYGIRIPVVLVDGQEVAEIRIGQHELEEALR